MLTCVDDEDYAVFEISPVEVADGLVLSARFVYLETGPAEMMGEGGLIVSHSPEAASGLLEREEV